MPPKSKLSSRRPVGLSLGSSQQQLIMDRANKVNQDYVESKKIPRFHDKYELDEEDETKKLGEGQHASVYLCCLKEETTEATEEKKGDSKQLKKFMTVDSLASELDEAD